MMGILKSLAGVALGALLAACGSSNNNTADAQVRLVNAASSSPLTLSLNSATEFSNVKHSSATGYSQIPAGGYTASITSSNGSLISATYTVGFGSGGLYSALAYDRNGAVIASLITENQIAPPTGYATFVSVNASPDSNPLDVYVVPPGTTTLTGLTPTFQYLQYGSSPIGVSFLAANYDVIVTATANTNDVRYRLLGYPIKTPQIVTLALTSTPGGALVNGVALNQAGSVGFKPNTYARVRLASALPVAAATPVTGSVGSTPFPTVYSPNPGTYTLVPGDSTSYSISVAGTPLATLPPATFATGQDYTIVVYGTTASPLVSVFTDNNQAPVSGAVRLRLINAGSTAAGGVTMYCNNIQVANSVLYGATAPYFDVAVSSTGSLVLIYPGIPTPATGNISLTTPGAVYTIFVIDSSLTPYTIRDR